VSFSSSERVHVAKAGAQAESSALRSAASRAQATHQERTELAEVKADANDLVVFMAIWIGLSGRHSGQVRMPVQSNVVRPESAIQSEQTPRREPKTLFQRRANDNTNVVPFHAA